MCQSEGSDSLPNNLHALHMVELKMALTACENTVTARVSAITTLKSTITSLSNTNTKLNNIHENEQLVFVATFNSHSNFLTKSQYFSLSRLWCVTCKRLAKATCHEQKHKLTDFGKDVEEFHGWLVELETDAHQGIGKVDYGQGHLAKEMQQLMAKVKAVEVKMEQGEGLRQKLVEIVAHCVELKQLPLESKATVFMRKNLRQAIADTKQEVLKAEEFVNGLGIIVPVVAKKRNWKKTRYFC